MNSDIIKEICFYLSDFDKLCFLSMNKLFNLFKKSIYYDTTITMTNINVLSNLPYYDKFINLKLRSIDNFGLLPQNVQNLFLELTYNNKINQAYAFDSLKIIKYLNLSCIKKITINSNANFDHHYLCGPESIDITFLKFFTEVKELFIDENLVERIQDIFDYVPQIQSVHFLSRYHVQSKIYSFKNCKKLQHISFCSYFNQSLNNLFDHCPNLQSVSFNNFFDKPIGLAFKNCPELRSIRFGSEFNQYMANNFKQCPKLSKIYLAKRCPTKRLQKNHPKLIVCRI